MNQLPWDLDFRPTPIDGAAIALDFDAASGRLQASLTNTSSHTLRPANLELAASITAGAAGGSLWLHGRYMHMYTFVRNFGAPAEDGYSGHWVSDIDGGHRYVSREVSVANLPSRATPAILAGSLRLDRFFFNAAFDVDDDEMHLSRVSLTFDLDGLELAPGESLALPPILLIDGRDPLVLLERYADEVASEMQARVPEHVPTGWCSWYYFYHRVSEADVVANLADMVATKHPAEYVQVDDGFQSFTGDWLVPNEKFPSGMKALADRIRESGYKPGLWLAPFVLHEDSAALREHPEMALKTREGETFFVQTWLGRCAVLDCTHPESEAWLRNTIRTVVRGWGYGYLKLDALMYAARPASQMRYHQAGTTALANLRRGLEIIRDEAGGRTFILGCTCHFGAAIGLVDAMRVGPDVKEIWFNGQNPSVKHAMRQTLERNWMHNRWWANDPDCLIVRETDTELNEAEVRFLATGIALSGGLVVASDDLPKLGPGRRDMALALFPAPGVAADPVDPLDGPVPRAWRADLGEGRFLVGVLNWTDQPTWVPTGEYLRAGEVAFDVWNGRVVGMGDQMLRPHEGTLWQVASPGPTPRVVGDTGHLAYNGLFQRPVSGRIQLRNDLDRTRTVAVEARGRVVEVELAPGEMRWFD